jgi:flagellar FliL protein
MSETAQSGVSRVFLSIIIVVLIALVGAVTFLIMNQRGSAGQIAAAKSSMGPTTSLGEFTVNLADNKSFVRATIVIELGNKKVEKELKERDAQIKHNIISTLRSTKPDQIADANGGMNNLSVKVKDNINSLLNSGAVTNVYFTQFVIQ